MHTEVKTPTWKLGETSENQSLNTLYGCSMRQHEEKLYIIVFLSSFGLFCVVNLSYWQHDLRTGCDLVFALKVQSRVLCVL